MANVFERKAGAFLFLGAAQFLILLIVAEALYPGYSTSSNFISDLGVGPSSYIFNPSVFFLGLCMALASHFISKASGGRILPALLLLSGIGAMGVGIFHETDFTPHYASAFLAFSCGALSALYCFRILRPPFSYFSAFLGIFSLAALCLSMAHVDLGLGPGGIERMIVYPILAWALSFSGMLLSRE
ncbi:MAG: DUF998 domain-containing protein [Syntrophales bacterium]|nr:DUF998 domain-containing protein [Candidatus ainarchaeum sp.]MDD5096323.1 DUF998 domain-containing protein [Candidatus ainarchaeum sp.]MDD5533594.1 DUF998 domain-containing protein [Syntrophales bacterium]